MPQEMKIQALRILPWEEDPLVADVLQLYKASKKRKLPANEDEPSRKRHKKENKEISKERSPVTSPQPIGRKNISRRMEGEPRGKTGKDFDRECARLQQEGTKMKRDTHEVILFVFFTVLYRVYPECKNRRRKVCRLLGRRSQVLGICVCC